MSELQPPVKRETVRSQVEKYLRDAITGGTFKSGEKLIERDLCERLSISRPSLREALRTLEAEKLITNIPHHGPMVRRMSLQEAMEVYALRTLLESYAVGEFTKRASFSDVEHLAVIVKRLKRAARGGDKEEYLEIKSEFYAAILEGCGNILVREILEGLYARINFLRATSLKQEGRLAKSIREIEAIQKCIKGHDPVGASKKAGIHVGNAQKAIMNDDSAVAGSRVAGRSSRRMANR